MHRIKFATVFIVILVGFVTYCAGYENIQRVISYQREKQAVNFEGQTDKGEKVFVKIDVCTSDMLRVRMAPNRIVDREQYIVVKDSWEKVDFTVSAETEEVLIKTQCLLVKVIKEPFKLSIYDRDNDLILSCIKMGYENGKVSASMEPSPEEHFFGFGAGAGRGGESGFEGEVYNLLDKSHQELNIRGRRIPFFMSTKGYGVFLNSTRVSTFNMGKESDRRYSFQTPGNQLDYYFIYGPSFKHILARYTELTGRAPLIPKWGFGLTQSGFWKQTECEDFCKTYRDKGIPCDLLHIDSNWLNKGSKLSETGMGTLASSPFGYVDFKWDKRQFPNLEGMISRLSRQGFKFSLWEVALVNPNVGEFYEDGAEQGYFVKNPDGSVCLVPYGFRGPAAIVDFSNPAASRWWKEQHKYLVDMGVNSFKLDIAGDLGTAKDAIFYNGKSLDEMRVLYRLGNLKTVFQAVKDYTNRRGMIGSSIATAGTQRYPVHWSGDYASNFAGLQSMIRTQQNMGLSGFALYRPAIGGHRKGEISPELFIRWAQFGLFSSLTEVWSSLPQNLPWRFGEKIEEIFRQYAVLRYQLLPYIYSYAWIANQRGVPIVRAMVLEYQDDPEVYNKGLQYMLGRELLIAPIYEAASSPGEASEREVYLPEGQWIDYATGKKYEPRKRPEVLRGEGSQYIEYEAGLERLPIFVKAGAIIPMAPEMQWVDEKPWDPLTLDIYPSGESIFTLYEDDGETYAYEQGEFALTEFICKENADEVEINIGKSKGEYKGKLTVRSWGLNIHTKTPQTVRMDEHLLKQYKTREELLAVREGWWPNSSRGTVLVKISARDTKQHIRIYLEGIK